MMGSSLVTNSARWKQRGTDTPFSVVEPGGQITNMFGFGPGLLGKDPVLKPFKAIVTYEWQPFWSKRRRIEKRHYDIDVRPFSGLVPERKKDEVAEALKAELPKIAKAIGVIQRPPVPADRKSGGETFFRRIESLMPALFAEMRSRVHNLDGEQVCRGHGAPMSPDEGAPRHALAPLRRRSDTVVGEDPLDSVASEFMS